ncbi:hypothetical protein, partial [Acinetobacter pittii]|uniref:hypothetical protein n=1 Tax=Acinetobacter pittii TaxID=48296 RepID=UPI0013D2B5B6
SQLVGLGQGFHLVASCRSHRGREAPGAEDTDLPDGQPSVSAALDGQSRHHQVCPVGWQNPGVRSGSQGWKVRQKYRDEEVAPGREVVCAGGE